MSGSTGGNRILREDVEKTVKHYKETVLSKYTNYKTCVISGSYNYSSKQDFGDIDLIVELNASDKKTIKQDFAEFLSSFPTNIIMPFISVKYKGKRYLNTGEIITILYPIKGYNNKAVQIDNIVSLSSEETYFKTQFLDLPAIKQGLMLGLIKCIVLEKPAIAQKYLISRALKHNQEFEFNLSSSGLSLRLVDLTPEYKTLNSVDIWKTTDWNVVEELLQDYNFDQSFKSLVDDIKNSIKNPRSINRIKGIFKSMVSVKSGEVDTPKGAEKDYALRIISQL